MAKKNTAGRGDRFSALWGTTKRDGETRGSALWGNGGRGGAILLALIVALVIPLAAGAGPGPSGPPKPGSNANVLITDTLLSAAQSSPKTMFKVIVQGDGSKDADKVAHKVADFAAQANKQLADAVKKADDAAKKAQDAADQAADKAAKAQQDADKAQADATAKALKAATSGKAGDVKAALDAAKAAADKAAKAAQAQKDADAAQAAADQAQAAATSLHVGADALADKILKQQVTDQFSSISGVAARLTGEQIVELSTHDNAGLLSITPDAPVQVSASPWSSAQTWPYASGAAGSWGKQNEATTQANMPSIAIVDSGVQSRSDFGARVVASVDLTSLPNNSPGDGRGHGTFVAGVAASSAPNSTGTAPAAKIVSIDVMDDSGMGLTSDIIRACQWILDNKAKYNIRVANFSLHSDITAPFYIDPLDRAVEQLWFNGVTVVAASGNYRTTSGPSGVLYSPGNDPFVITVGAADLGNKPDPGDDTIAPWSAWGYTLDGFSKPELSAPGRYIVGPVPANSTLVTERPENVTSAGYIQLSGTSFAAPVVAGAAAYILARHPNFTPDQVKGALMLKARPLNKSVGLAGGVGEVTVNTSGDQNNPPNPNAGLSQFVRTGSTSGSTSYSFDSASWNSASWNSASWNSASWNSASWNSASWNSASWNSASWNSASWNSASWNSASWNSASWNTASHEDAAEGDSAADPSTYTLDPSYLAELLTESDLAPDLTSLPSFLTTTTTSTP